MRVASVFINGRLAGRLSELSPSEFVFRYDDAYYADSQASAISLTLPKYHQEYQSSYLFPFFSNMLAEGHNRAVQARLHKLDLEDDFGFLLATAQTDTPGAITVKPV